MHIIISPVRNSIEELENDNLEFSMGRFYKKPQHAFITSFISLKLLVINIDALLYYVIKAPQA